VLTALQSQILSIVNEMTTLCVSVKAQSGNEVILGTVGSSSMPVIVLGALGRWRPHIFIWTGPGLE